MIESEVDLLFFVVLQLLYPSHEPIFSLEIVTSQPLWKPIKDHWLNFILTICEFRRFLLELSQDLLVERLNLGFQILNKLSSFAFLSSFLNLVLDRTHIVETADCK